MSFEYYKENEDEFTTRLVEPYALINGRDGWYLAAFDPTREDLRHFRLDRIKSANVTEKPFEPRPDVDPIADVDGWPRTGELPASRRARVWISPEPGPLGTRGAHGLRGSRGRLGDRRFRLRRNRLPGTRGAQGGRATRSCSSRPDAREAVRVAAEAIAATWLAG